MIKAANAQDGRNQLIDRAQALLQKLETSNGGLEIPLPLRTLIENRLKNRDLETPSASDTVFEVLSFIINVKQLESMTPEQKSEREVETSRLVNEAQRLKATLEKLKENRNQLQTLYDQQIARINSSQ